MQGSVIFIVLRRMRSPLVVLILAYAIALTGLVLIPGVDNNGQAWDMSFFHAFYLISYTATTIGFGEIPYALTDAQRMWVTVSIYLTVIAWFYSIGNIIALLQDPSLTQYRTLARFARQVQRIQEPFFLLCGCGDSGRLLLGALDSRGHRVVVVDNDPEQITELELLDSLNFVPSLCAEVGRPDNLKLAGIAHPQCRAVIALTKNDRTNLAVVLTSKLLNPEIPVICRAESQSMAASMKIFGADYVIDPFERFGHYLATAVSNPGNFVLRELLTDVPGTDPPRYVAAPPGPWVVFGYGRFGSSVVANLRAQGMEVRVVEQQPLDCGGEGCLIGQGTDPEILVKSGLKDAAGLVAGTNDDLDNLAILVEARELNPDLFTVIRKNRLSNELLFDSVVADIAMQPSEVISQFCLGVLTSPALVRFLDRCEQESNSWALTLVERIMMNVGHEVPEVWTVRVDPKETPGLYGGKANLVSGRTLGRLYADPRDRDQQLPCVPLMLIRNGEDRLLPEDGEPLAHDDLYLFCGTLAAQRAQGFQLRDWNVAHYLLTGSVTPGGSLWRYLEQRGA